MASPLHRHQASLESVLNFSPETPVFESNDAREHAQRLFAELLQRLESSGDIRLSTPYQRIVMVRLMHQYSRTQPSKDLYLQSFFSSIGVDMAADLPAIDMAPLPNKVVEFTDYLFGNFFLPIRASSTKTPQPTPASLSVPTLSSDQVLPGSTHRLATLRRDCLIRDKHRCVISRKFDEVEARNRVLAKGNDAADDEGKRFVDLGAGPDDFAHVEVAHILPHSLMSLDGDAEMQTARRNAIAILDMFDVGVRHLIEGFNIDRPTNALTLTAQDHSNFGAFLTFFEETGVPHTYQIKSHNVQILRRPTVTRTLFLSEDRTIDPPLPRLLALHAAISNILHMSGAGFHCDDILRDTEELVVKADGTTNLGTLAALRLGGWWDGVVV